MIDVVAQKSFEGLLAQLREELGPTSFDTWVGAATLMELRRGTMVIGLRSEMHCTWVEHRYRGAIMRIAEEVFGIALRVELQIDPVRARQHKESLRQESLRAQESEVVEAEGRPKRPRKGDFVVVPENQFAQCAIQSVAQADNPALRTLFLVGAKGSGKSHLLEALRDARRADGQKAEVFINDAVRLSQAFTLALKKRSVDAFRRTYERCDIIVIDEAHRLKNKSATQTELLTLVKMWKEEGRRIIFASRHAPRDIHRLSDGLRSFFLGCVRLDIEEYSPQSMAVVHGGRIGVDRRPLPTEIVADYAHGCDGDVAELDRRLVRIAAFAGVLAEPLTAAFAKVHRSEIVKASGPTDNRDTVIRRVCEHFRVERGDLISKTKRAFLRMPRGFCVCVLRDGLSLTHKEIGRIFGDRSHTSIHNLYQRYRTKIDADPDLRSLHCELTRHRGQENGHA